MPDNPRATLEKVFGYREFRPYQEEIVTGLIRGEDALVIMPTGGGKSLCYQIPALHRPGTAIVVSPLISLMKDQVDALRANGIRAAALNSSLPEQAGRAALSELHAGRLDLLYIAPERLLSEAFLARLQDIRIALVAIDEAHCISQWGHDFRPEYIQLGRLRALLPGVPMIALTATADRQTRRDIAIRLGMEHARQYVSSFDRPNIRIMVVDKQHPFEQLGAFLAGRPEDEPGIVYALSRATTENIAGELNRRGIPAAAYHAGMEDRDRARVQESFLRDELRVVAATVAFGMGIDKPNVRFVIHFDLPKHLEGYYQEIGRAGRDGLPAEALLLYSVGDAQKLRGFIEQVPDPDRQRIETAKLNAMLGFAGALSCRRRVLLGYFGEYPDSDCGNCDICLKPPRTFDATEDARKALSCVYRVGQRFGMGYVIQVLRGSRSSRIIAAGHDRLSTFGIGSGRTVEEWTAIVRQLIHLGYLEQDIASYSVLRLTGRARPLLRGEERLELARPRTVAAGKGRGGRRGPVPEADAPGEPDEQLYQALRALRKKIADEENVPPYIIFGDSTLLEMAARRPADRTALSSITGVGKVKLKRYGKRFLGVIRKHGKPD